MSILFPGPVNARDREWAAWAVRVLEGKTSFQETQLHRLWRSADDDIEIVLKDESAHETGSLKHRLAISLFLYSVVNGYVGPRTTVVEASSGSTAISEAYIAKELGLHFVAIVPRTTSAEKVRLIEESGGECEFVESSAAVYARAEELGSQRDFYYMDQFTNAERATDWRTNNIAAALIRDCHEDLGRNPEWIVVGAGTGGTATTIGRYLRYRGLSTNLLVVDPENSVFTDHWLGSEKAPNPKGSSRIEGIGRPRAEPSFFPSVVDAMTKVPDSGSIAAMQWTSEQIGWRVGPSTGTNVWGAAELAAVLADRGESAIIASLICDSGTRYGSTYYDDSWLAAQGLAYVDDLRELNKRLPTSGVPRALLPALRR